MLFYPSGYPKPVRLQGAFIDDQEVSSIVEFLSSNNNNDYSDELINKIETSAAASKSVSDTDDKGGNDKDQYFVEAGKFIIEKDKASIGMLQRVYKIGFNRAARIMDQLYDAGVVGPEEGTKPGKVLMSMEQFEQYIEEYL
jgi:S-DNA-T family DNA segregation ATPase FtsK/SpoIIIE